MQLAFQLPAAARLGPNPARQPARFASLHAVISRLCSSSSSRCAYAVTAVAAAGVPPPAAAAAAPAPPAASPSAPTGAALTHFSSLYIRDFALVQEQRLHLAPGLTAITGKR